PPGRSLADMMAAGELQAGFDANAGIGRAGPPAAGWEKTPVPASNYPDLFSDPEALEAAWYRRTGIYPMHGTIVVKESVLREHAWVARSIADAFEAAKVQWLSRLSSGSVESASDRKYLALSKIVGGDPLPNGLNLNLPTIRALEETAFKQQLTPRRM